MELICFIDNCAFLTLNKKYIGEKTPIIYDPNTLLPVTGYIIVKCDDGHCQKLKKDDYFIGVEEHREQRLHLLGL